jgi:hypothetical protein
MLGFTSSRLAAAVGAAALGAILVGGASGAVGAAVTTYNDTIGERADAPDVGAVTASLDGDVVSISVSAANLPPLFEDGTAIFMFDTDRNAATGGPFGDLAFFIDWKTLSSFVGRWSGSEYVPATKAADPSRFLVGGSSFGLMVHRANLGATDGFDFAVLAGRGSLEEGRFDVAPDRGAWSFSYTAPAPPEAPTPAAPVVEDLSASFVPAQPRAGKRFALGAARLRLSNGETARPDSIGCVARLAGRVLRPVGRCAWRIPANARGKRLVVTLTPRYEGETARFEPWSFRVR